MQSSAKIVSKISTKTCKAATYSSCKDTKRKEREAKEHQVLSNNVKEAQITNVKLQIFDAEQLNMIHKVTVKMWKIATKA